MGGGLVDYSFGSRDDLQRSIQLLSEVVSEIHKGICGVCLDIEIVDRIAMGRARECITGVSVPDFVVL